MVKIIIITLTLIATTLSAETRFVLIGEDGKVSTARSRNGIEMLPDGFDPAEVAHKFDFRPLREGDKPVPGEDYDPTTHKPKRLPLRVEATAVWGEWTVVPLTAKELERRTWLENRESVKNSARAKLRDLSFTDLEIRALAIILQEEQQ